MTIKNFIGFIEPSESELNEFQKIVDETNTSVNVKDSELDVIQSIYQARNILIQNTKEG